MNYSLKSNRLLFGIFTAAFLLFAAAAIYYDQFIIAAIPFTFLLVYSGWQNISWIYFLLILAIPFSTELNFSGNLATDFPDEQLMWILSMLSFFYVLYKPGILSKDSRAQPLLIILTLLICWTFFTTIFSSDKIVSGKFLLAKSWYIGAFVIGSLIIFSTKNGITKAAVFLVLSMLLVCLLILYKHSQTDFSFATVNEAVIPFFRNHVNYSALLVCTLPVCFAIVVLTNNKTLRLVAIIAGFIFLLALFFSYARGAWLALLFGLLGGWLIRKKALFISYLATIIILTGLVFWLKTDDRYLRYAHEYKSTIYHKDFSEHFVSTYKLKDLSTAERFYRWIAGLRMIKDHWLTGSGPNTFYPNYKRYTVPAYKTWVSDNPEHSTVHNYFLLTAIEQGIPGLLFLLLLLAAMIYYAEKIYHRSKKSFDRIAALAIGVMIVMIATVNFLSDLVETDKIGSLFFILIAALVFLDVKNRSSDLPPDVQRVP